MPELNPNINPQGDINSDRSRGRMVDTSLAGFVQNTNQLFDANLDQANRQILRQAYSDASTEIGAVRDDAIARLSGPIAGGDTAVDGYANRVQALNQARQAGTLSESHYWAILDVTTRRLRQKYPGYRREIDEIIRTVAGADPANRLVNELMQQRNAGRGSEEARHQHWLNEATKLGLPIAATYQQAVQAGNPPSTLDLQAAVARSMQDKAQREATTLAIQQRKLQGEDVSQEAYRAAVTNIYRQLGADWTGITQSISNFNQQVEEARAGRVPPQRLLELQDLFRSTIQRRVTDIVNTTLDMPGSEGGLSYGAMINDVTKVKQIRDMFKDMIENMGAQISPNGDWSLFTRYNTELQAITRDATSSVLNDPNVGRAVARMKGLSDLLGNQTYQRIMGIRLPGTNATLEASLARGLEKLFIEDTGLSGLTDEFRNNPSTSSQAGQLTRTAIDRITTVIADKNAPEQAVETAARSLFDTQRGDFFKTYTAAGRNNAARLYKMILGNAELHQGMLRIQRTNPQLYAKYSEWVVNNFAHSVEQEADRLRQFSQSANDNFATLQFDTRTNRFVISDPNNKYTAERQALENINAAVQGFTNFLAARPNSDPDKIIRAVAKQIDRLRIDTSQTPQHGMWKAIKTYVSRFIDEVTYTPESGLPEYAEGPGSPQGGSPTDYAGILNTIGSSFAPARSDQPGGTAGGNAYNRTEIGGVSNLTSMPVSEVSQLFEDFPTQRIGRYGITKAAFEDSLNRMSRTPGFDPSSVTFDKAFQDALMVDRIRAAGAETLLLNDSSDEVRKIIVDRLLKDFPGVDRNALDEAVKNFGNTYGRFGRR